MGFGIRRVYFSSTKETHATIKGGTIFGYDGCIDSSTPTSIDITDSGVSPLGRLSDAGVEYINIQQCENLDTIDLSSLDGCLTLQGIRIFRNKGTFKRLVLPSGCPVLSEVTIESNYPQIKQGTYSPMSPVDLSVLDGSPNLRYLRLNKNGCSLILPSKCPSLEVINLTKSKVEDWRLDGCPELKLVMLTSLGPETIYSPSHTGKITPHTGETMTLDLNPLLRHYMSAEAPPIIYISDEYDLRVEDNITDYDRLPNNVRDRIIQYSYGTRYGYFIFLEVGEKTGEEARSDPVYKEYREISYLYGEEVASRYADLRPPPDKNL